MYREAWIIAMQVGSFRKVLSCVLQVMSTVTLDDECATEKTAICKYNRGKYNILEDLGAMRPSFQLLRRAGPCGPCWGPSAPSRVAISQNSPKIVQKWSQKSPKMVQKGFQNVHKMVPKWSQNGPKMVQKQSQMVPKQSQNGPKIVPLFAILELLPC